MNHQWVKHTITPISTLIDPNNEAELFIIEDPQDVQDAEDQAVFGCNICGLPMQGNTETGCEGEQKND